MFYIKTNKESIMTHLTEAFSDQLKKSFGHKSLNLIGKLLARQHIAADSAEFIKVPSYRFRLSQALPNKMGDTNAKFGIVLAITKKDEQILIIVKSNTEASYFVIKSIDNHQPLRYTDGEKIENFSSFIKDLKEVYICTVQQDVYSKQLIRSVFKKTEDKLLTDKSAMLKTKLKDYVETRGAISPYLKKIIQQIESRDGFKVQRIALTNEYAKNRFVFPSIEIEYNPNTGIAYWDKLNHKPFKVKTFKVKDMSEKLEIECHIPSFDINTNEQCKKVVASIKDISEVYEILTNLDLDKLPKVDTYQG